MGLFSRKILNNGYLFLPKWPLKMGRGLRLERHTPVQTKSEYPRGFSTTHIMLITMMRPVIIFFHIKDIRQQQNREKQNKTKRKIFWHFNRETQKSWPLHLVFIWLAFQMFENQTLLDSIPHPHRIFISRTLLYITTNNVCVQSKYKNLKSMLIMSNSLNHNSTIFGVFSFFSLFSF